MHRRKDLYGDDADVFRPERWLDTDEGKGLRMGWEYLPFSGGPRVCPGRMCLSLSLYLSKHLAPSSLSTFSTSYQTTPKKIGANFLRQLENFALTEVSYLTIRLMQEFRRLESRDPAPWREHLTLVCTNLGGCKVALFPSEDEMDV